MASVCSFTRLYPIYVLFLLMVAYLTNQADRFVLGIASEKISVYLDIGHEGCFPNLSYTGDVNQSTGCSTDCQKQTNENECYSDDGCSWGYLPTGFKYQVLAGPAFIVIFALSSLPMGLLASTPFLRRTIILSICAFLWSTMTLLTGFVTQYWQIVLARFGLGIFQAACTPFASSLISDYFKPEYRGTALSLYSWGVYIGYSLAFAFNIIVETYGWRWAFRIASFPGFLVSVLLLFTVKEPSRRQNESDSKEMTINNKYKYNSRFSLIKLILSSYFQLPLILLCIGAGLRQGGGLVWAYNAKSYFRLLHCDVHGVGMYISWVPVVGGSLGVVIGGYISDRLVKRWSNVARIAVLAVSTFLSIPFLFGTLFLPLPAAFFSLLLSYGVGEMWFGVCIAVAIELVPVNVSSASVSLYLFIVNIIGGNLNLLLPSLQRQMGLQYSMIVLFPGAYFIAGIFFILTGLTWKLRYIQPVVKDDSSSEETTSLIQNTNEDFTHMLTESQEIQRRLSKRQTCVSPDPFRSESRLSVADSYTASI